MNVESFKLWLIYLKTHPIIRTIKALKKKKNYYPEYIIQKLKFIWRQ